MAQIHKNLILDHLYFSANEEEFEEIKTIFLRFQCATNQIVNADDSSWEGVYIRTRGQNYLEILKDRRVNGIGLCQKSFGQLTQDARHITNDFPELPWKTFERTISGRKWFTAVSCENYLDLSTPFNTWVMHYYQSDNEKIFPLPKFEISKISEIHFSAHPSLIETIKLNSTWFNSERQFTENSAIFNIQTYYSDPFLLRIDFDNSAEGFKFNRALFELEYGISVPDLNLKYFRFFSDGKFQILCRN